MNQCDGCKDQRPLIDGRYHRMGDGPYPDIMFCEKERYEPEFDDHFLQNPINHESDDAGNEIYVGGEPPVITEAETKALDRFNTLKVKGETDVLTREETTELALLEVELGI